MTFHKDLTLSDIHSLASYSFADTTARDAASWVAADNHKLVYITGTGTYYLLKDYSGPTWQEIGAGGGSSDHGGLTGLADDDHTQYSLISSQAGAPSSTPTRVGEINIDTTNDNVYVSTDTASSGDWTQVDAAGSGETNTASNVGTAGVGVFKQKTGVDLEFKKINAGSSKVSITDDTGNDELDIDVVEANIDHDSLSGFVANEHIDWTQSGAGTIHATNYVDNDTTDHTLLSNIGTNTHAQIDSHIADADKHRDILQGVIASRPAFGTAGRYYYATDEKKWYYDTGSAWDLSVATPDSHTHTASEITDFDTEVSNNTSVAANTAKVTNATHTGDVTGSTALTVDKTAITGKTLVTAVGTDHVLIADSSDTDNLKKALVSDFLGAGTDNDAIHDNVASEISAITEKTTPVSADLLIIEDSADSNNKKRVQIGNLPGGGNEFADNLFRIQDNGDSTKEIAFEASGITTSTTRTITMPDMDVRVRDINIGAASGLPAAGTAGRFYYTTDTDALYYDNGSTWDTGAVGLQVGNQFSGLSEKTAASNGDRIILEDSDTLYVKKYITKSNLVGTNAPIIKYVTTDRTNDTASYVTISDLNGFALDASGIYAVEGFYQTYQNNSSGNAYFSALIQTATLDTMGISFYSVRETTLTGQDQDTATSSDHTGTEISMQGGTNHCVRIQGFVAVTSAASGNMAMRYKQGTAQSGNPLTIKKGSWVKLTKLN